TAVHTQPRLSWAKDAYPPIPLSLAPSPDCPHVGAHPFAKKAPLGRGCVFTFPVVWGSSNPTSPNFHTRVSLIRTASLSVAGRSPRRAPPPPGRGGAQAGLALAPTGLGGRHD